MEMGQVAAKCWMREFRNTKRATSKNFSVTNGIYCLAQLDERDHLNLLGTFAINDFAIPFVTLHCIFYVCFACFLRIGKYITCLAIYTTKHLLKIHCILREVLYFYLLGAFLIIIIFWYRRYCKSATVPLYVCAKQHK